jgi:phage N-6-adenine-methyltransferase
MSAQKTLKQSLQNRLGLLLRAERKVRRLTQAKVARKARLSIPTIRLQEKGGGNIRTWTRILDSLALTVRGRNLPAGPTLGGQIAFLRRRRGLGQRALCKLIGVSQPTLVKLERHTAGRLSTLDRALTVLGAGPKLVRRGTQVKFFTHANTSSAHHGWSTPNDLLDILYRVFGRFDLDPCSPSANPRRAPVRARTHYTVEDDALSLPWHGAVFINPPYGRALPYWTAKIRNEFVAGNVKFIVAVLPARTDTHWWHKDVASSAAVFFLRGRLYFGASGQAAPFPSALAIWGASSEQLSALQAALPNAWTPQTLLPPTTPHAVLRAP